MEYMIPKQLNHFGTIWMDHYKYVAHRPNFRPDPSLIFCDGVITVVGNCFAEDFLIVVANIFEVGFILVI